MSTEKETNSWVLKWLPLIIPLVVLIASYSVLQYRLANAESNIEKVTDGYTQILVKLTTLQSDVSWIKASTSRRDTPYYQSLIERK